MSSSDPLRFAAQVSGMSDDQLRAALHRLAAVHTMGDYERAVMDEAQIRGIFSARDARSHPLPMTAQRPSAARRD